MALIVPLVDTFIEKPFSVLTLSFIPAPHPMVGGSQNTQQPARSKMAATKQISKHLTKTQMVKPSALTPADKARKLVAGDRDFGERRLCLQSTNVIRPGGVWTCTKWRAAGVGISSISINLILLLHRCDAFENFDAGHRRGGDPSTVQKFTRKSLL